MTIRFKVTPENFNRAIDVVSIVEPRSWDGAPTGAGYLFRVRGEIADVYARDGQHVTRASFPIFDVEGEGAFVFPAAHIQSFKFATDTIDIDVQTSAEKGGSTQVKYNLGNGAGGTRPSFDPKYVLPCDKEFEESTNPREFSATALREAFQLAREFHPSSLDNGTDPNNTIQIFDKDYEADEVKEGKPTGNKWKPYARGDGSLYACNGKESIHVEMEAFKGRSLSVHASHIGMVSGFLGKCTGKVRITTGANMTFACDEGTGNVFGWTHATKQHNRYAYLKTETDTHILNVNPDDLRIALKHIGVELEDKKTNKIRLNYNDATSTIQLQIVDGNSKGIVSREIPVSRLPEMKDENRRSISVRTKHNSLGMLFDGVKGNSVVIRIWHQEKNETRSRDSALFRTIDEFVLGKDGKILPGGDAENATLPEGAVKCKVTRMMPSYD